MTSTLANAVSFLAASAGAGDFAFGHSRDSFLTLAQAVTLGELVDGQSVSYLAQNSLVTPTQREWGYGTFHSAGFGSITRTTVLGTVDTGVASSGVALNFNAAPVVALTALASDIGFGLLQATSNMTFYVSTTGSDSSPGTLAAPFATIQHALIVAASYDYQMLYTATVQILPGTYNGTLGTFGGNLGFVTLPSIVNPPGTSPRIIGDNTTPANVVVSFQFGSFTSAFVALRSGSQWNIRGLQIDTARIAFDSETGSIIFPTNCNILDSSLSGDLRFFNAYNDGQVASAGTFRLLTTPASLIAAASQYGNVLFDTTTIVFPAITTIGGIVNLAFTAFATCYNNTYTNGAGVTGFPAALNQRSLLQTEDGTINNIPGGLGFFGDSDPSCVLSNNAIPTEADPMIQSHAGFVTPVSPFTWHILKDTVSGRRYLSVNDGGTTYSLQVVRTINTQGATPYTLVFADQDGRIEMNLAGANTVSVPLNAAVAFPIGTEIRVVQIGAGATTITAVGGVTGDNFGAVGGQWKSVVLYKRAADEWVMTNV